MVAKVYRFEDMRISEADLLRLAYRIADTDPDVRGHVPILVASEAWPDPSAESMAAILGEHILGKNNERRATSCLRILLFLQLEPMFCLTGRYFMKAYLECFKCRCPLFPLSMRQLSLATHRSLGAVEEGSASSRHQQEQPGVLQTRREGPRSAERLRLVDPR